MGDTLGAARQRAVLARIQTLPFKPADNSHLLPVREMEATKLLLEARSSGVAGAMTEAQAELARITSERAALKTTQGR